MAPSRQSEEEIPIQNIMRYFQEYTGWEYIVLKVRSQLRQIRTFEENNANVLIRQGLDPDEIVPLPSVAAAVPPPPPATTVNRRHFLEVVVIWPSTSQ